MRWPLALMSGMTLVVLASGCRNCDKVERELRARDVDLQELRAEMERLECYNRALEHEVRGLQGGPGGPLPLGPGMPPPGLLPVRSITLGRQTGGYDTGTCPGDSALQVVLEPRDCDNHVVKVPGVVRVQALEITPEGTKAPLSEWDVPPDQLRAAWRNGLFGSGYTLILNWKTYPTTNKLRVIATFQAADGRVFEADKDVTVKVVPPGQRQAPAPDGKPAAPEDPFFPQTVPPDPTPAKPRPGAPKPPNRFPGSEKLQTPPAPVDLGPSLPPPLPTPGSGTTSTSGWGPPRGAATSTSGWGTSTSRPEEAWLPLDPGIQLEPPRPLYPEW